jgi:molecular chaperone HscC
MIVGIDLGTTNSAIAVWRSGKAELVPNRLGHWLTPSVVSLDFNGEILVGRPARERLFSHPDLTASGFKRYMGSRRRIPLGGKSFSAEELSAFVLKSLKADAELAFGRPITEAVISVPAHFNDKQRRATRRAGELAGLNVGCLINEPTAAALAHRIHRGKLGSKVLICGVGSGTLDVSILEMFASGVEVRASSGENFLGGGDFNELQFHSVLKQTVTRALRDSETRTDTLAQIVLVGAAARTPLVRKAITRMLGRFPAIGVNPDEAVALGSAVQAGLKARNAALKEVVLTDVCPHTIGVETGAMLPDGSLRSGLFTPVIERNTVVPASRMRAFSTVYDGQRQIEVKIYQGESRLVSDNVQLGALEIPVPPRRTGEITVECRFTYDVDGLLEVDVRIPQTGEKYQIAIGSRAMR